MPLPSIDDCECSCHNVGASFKTAHVTACCTGASLAWGSWGNDDLFEGKNQMVFSEEEED